MCQDRTGEIGGAATREAPLESRRTVSREVAEWSTATVVVYYDHGSVAVGISGTTILSHDDSSPPV
jgi:hypothetical protein